MTDQRKMSARILLFEPDRGKRSMHDSVLQTNGYHVESTGDEERANSLCASFRPDVLFVGLSVPLSQTFEVYDRFHYRHCECKVAFVPGEFALCDLYFDGTCIRREAMADFTGDVEKIVSIEKNRSISA